jgi:GxxExxY protein
MFGNILKNIHETLGPGYSEAIYHNALEVELRQMNIPYETERIIPIFYHDHVIGNLRADIIVDRSFVIELKAVRSLTDEHIEQVRRYLRLTGLSRGLAVNFGKKLEMREVNLESFSTLTVNGEEGFCLHLERS